MIVSKLSPSWFFGAFGTVIHTEAFNCFVSTARHPFLWKRWTTRLYLGDPGVDRFAVTYCTVIWAAHLNKNDIYHTHDGLSQKLDSAGEKGLEWAHATSSILSELGGRGIIENVIFAER